MSTFKLLEINIISAQDLPPVSKMLRTFAVAYIHPDHKLTTRIDHQGHTNPTWNYKIAFHIDDKFLKHESSAVTIEIYNLAWLRDLPIGTTRLLINNLSPPLHKNPAFRRVTLQICRPSGHLQGTLNLGVQLVDNYPVPGSEISSFSMRNDDQMNGEDGTQYHNHEEGLNYFIKEDDFQVEDKNPGARITSKNESICTTPTNRPESEPETKTVVTSCNSFFSVMRPLPTEVADDLKRGFYTTEWNDFGSSIFENWTELGDKTSDDHVVKSKGAQWAMEDHIPLTTHDKKHRTKRSDKKRGLMSCFGNAYGFQFSFICGSKLLKKKKKNRNVNKQNVHLMSLPEENLRGFYV
ncbi:hypothetical protein CDL12_05650 [Handroanthus impetiginosus]|uniref:C2 domain-containing protein n=1 Tax=Handroanthus impetiginosus TaxID=429701 RepID=A0A2G9HVW4_9LAMI|nr:hypothetical protein CDL12_05650 [Handroanthus impetiginosus]